MLGDFYAIFYSIFPKNVVTLQVEVLFLIMGILKNFESWANSDSNSNKPSTQRRGFESWAHPNRGEITRPSSNPVQDVDDAALYNPHSEYHNYHESIDDVVDDD